MNVRCRRRNSTVILWRRIFLYKMNALACSTLFLLCSVASTNGQRGNAAAPPTSSVSPTPAPAPAPEYVDLSQLLSVAGPFHIFLKYLQSTKLIETFQNQANNTDEGITIFVPKDSAFSSLKKPSVSNLTQDQLKSVLSFHAIPHYYTLSDFKNLSQQNPIPTFAGGPNFGLNFTDNEGTIRIDSGWTRTKVISAVHAADPVAIYETDRVLLPEAVFGTDIPPMPAPAPAPAASAPAADAPAADKVSSSSSSSSSTNSAASPASRRTNALGQLLAAALPAILVICC